MATNRKWGQHRPRIRQDLQHDDGQTALFQATRDGDKEELRLLLERESIDPGAKDCDGRTPLSHAAERGCGRLVELLLKDNQVDPDSVDNYGRTPLSRAAGGGHKRVVKMLLERDSVNPNSKDDDGRAPLLWAMKVGAVVLRAYKDGFPSGYGVAELLLTHERVDLNCRDSDGRTPLSHAAGLGYSGWVELLLKDNRVDPDSVDNCGRTPLSRAAGGGHEQVVKMLLGHVGVNPDSVDNCGRTPLSRAAGGGHEQVVRMLLGHVGVNPDSKDIAGRTPLLWAMAYSRGSESGVTPGSQRYGVVKLLLDQDSVDPNIRDREGQAPLSWAIEFFTPTYGRQLSVLDLLLAQSSISLESKDNHGRTLLSKAAENGKKMVVERLLEQKDINPDFEDDDRRTPLSQAAEHGHQAVVELLLRQSSVDVNSSDNYDRTPLWWAARAGHEAVVKSLLAKKEVDPESTDKDNHTPLLCAIENGHDAIVRLLMKRDRATLHMLAQRGSLAPLQSLLQHGSDVNIRDINGRAPLHTAALSGYANIVKELISFKADVDCEDTNGTTPLQIALEQKQQDIIQLLLEHSARTTGIMLAEWLGAYNRQASDAVLETSQMSSGKKSVQFLQERHIKVLAGTGPERRLLIFPEYPTWLRGLGCSPKIALERDRSEILHDVQIHSNHVTFFVVGAFPNEQQAANRESSLVSTWSGQGIAWTMIPPSKPSEGTCWKSIDHFSTLPYGWIPDDGAEFFALFIRKLKENWLELCATAEERLSQRRLDQLFAQGNSAGLINRLAEDAQELAILRSVLRGQVQSADSIVVKYCRIYDRDGGRKTMQSSTKQFAADVNEQLSRLDQTVKDLLQFEFAWVSINEAHRSTSIATSIKRLSWITFIFLPPMFASSLFGMNVDILQSNPDWRWYLLFGGGCLTLTVLVWLLFKYGRVESSVEWHLNGHRRQRPKGSIAISQLLKTGEPTLPK